MAAKASLYLAMREAGITRVLLARRLGVDEKEVRRMLNPRHPTKLPRIEQALSSLGKRLVVSLETEAA
jgi:antitoxin HicB